MTRSRYPGTLTAAIRDDDPARIRAAVARHGAGVLERLNAEGMNAIYQALRARHPRSLRTLLELGADPNPHFDSNVYPGTPLLIALTIGDPALVELLLRHGADPNPNPRAGKRTTPLVKASALGRQPCIRVLLAHGADPSAEDPMGDTPLAVAAARGDTDTIEVLLRHGADPTAADFTQRTPAEIAREQRHPRLAERLEAASRERLITSVVSERSAPDTGPSL